MVSQTQISFETPTPVGKLNPRSVMDYVVMNLRPTIQKQTFKKHGLKMSRKIFGTTINQPKLDLKTLTTQQRFSIIDKIDELPLWFDKQEYVDRIWKSYLDYFNDRGDLKRNLDALTQTPSIYSETNFVTLDNIMTQLYDDTVETSSEWYNKNMAEFLDSDLPFELYDMYNQSFLARLKLLDAIKRQFNKLQAAIHFHRSDETRFTHDVNYFRQQFTPLFEARASATDIEDLIRFYVKIKNATNMDDMFKIIPLTIAKLDMNIFNKYSEFYKISLVEYLETLENWHYKEQPDVFYPESEAIKEFQKDIGQYVLKYP